MSRWVAIRANRQIGFLKSICAKRQGLLDENLRAIIGGCSRSFRAQAYSVQRLQRTSCFSFATLALGGAYFRLMIPDAQLVLSSRVIVFRLVFLLRLNVP
jgi:hypothetical protein